MPLDVLQLIFEHVPTESLWELRIVCKDWYKVLRRMERVWRELMLYDGPRTYRPYTQHWHSDEFNMCPPDCSDIQHFISDPDIDPDTNMHDQYMGYMLVLRVEYCKNNVDRCVELYKELEQQMREIQALERDSFNEYAESVYRMETFLEHHQTSPKVKECLKSINS